VQDPDPKDVAPWLNGSIAPDPSSRGEQMPNFASQPPSQRAKPLGKFFQGGMMPAAPRDVAALIIIDLRSLNLPASEGKAIELAVRDFVFQEIDKRCPLTNHSAMDLSTSVFGIAID
jgi:hypothetical protein